MRMTPASRVRLGLEREIDMVTEAKEMILSRSIGKGRGEEKTRVNDVELIDV
jgi:hypothetical protein